MRHSIIRKEGIEVVNKTHPAVHVCCITVAQQPVRRQDKIILNDDAVMFFLQGFPDSYKLRRDRLKPVPHALRVIRHLRPLADVVNTGVQINDIRLK